MSKQFYPRADGVKTPVELPDLGAESERDGAAYKADDGLIDAVNVALFLGQPLLLTGEPGTGKTQLAYSVGYELGYKVLKFDTKSTSTARDLFYTYDALGHFHAVQLKRTDISGKDFITYNALGVAILRSREKGEVERWLPGDFEHGGKKRSVVLIDEIDKAPRDFPNDLLNEIDEMSFRVPELGQGNTKVRADRALRPVVIITSNLEKSLPDAFLRRCIFYHIPPPNRERLEEIAAAHKFGLHGREKRWVAEALEFFIKVRDLELEDKAPSTAELLNWLKYLRAKMGGDGGGLSERPRLLLSGIKVLLKNEADQKAAERMVRGVDEEEEDV